MPKWSAVISGTPGAAEFGINADHRSMTKFSNADNEDFKKLSHTLEFMLQRAGPKVEANWTFEARTKQGNQLCYSGAGYRLDIQVAYGRGSIYIDSVTFDGFRYTIAVILLLSTSPPYGPISGRDFLVAWKTHPID